MKAWSDGPPCSVPGGLPKAQGREQVITMKAAASYHIRGDAVKFCTRVSALGLLTSGHALSPDPAGPWQDS